MELFERLRKCKFCGAQNIAIDMELLVYECETRLEIPHLNDSHWVRSETCKARKQIEPHKPAQTTADSAVVSGSSVTKQAQSPSTATRHGTSKAKANGGKARNAGGTIRQKSLPNDDAIPF